MDPDPGWHLLEPGQLRHGGSDLTVETCTVFPEPPRRLVIRADLDPQTAASQHPGLPMGG